MKALFNRLNWASRVLLGLFIVLAALALHNYRAYAPGSRYRLRTFYRRCLRLPGVRQ